MRFEEEGGMLGRRFVKNRMIREEELRIKKTNIF